jgi:hypothetical protein
VSRRGELLERIEGELAKCEVRRVALGNLIQSRRRLEAWERGVEMDLQVILLECEATREVFDLVIEGWGKKC